MVSTSPYHCLTLSLLLIPPLLFTTYFLSAFPNPPAPLFMHPSLASLPPDARSWKIYPEEYYSGGGYAEFPSGRVRYWLLGPETGKKIVLIHGLSIPAMIWKDVAPALANSGYRVLLYDLYGRGYSDAPDTIYNTNLYTTQLAQLMQYLNWNKANIVGVSMGGAIAATFTAQFPHLVDDGVALIACAGLMESTDISRTAKFMSSPLVRTLASSRPVRAYLQRLTNQTVTNSKGGKNNDSAMLEIVRLQSAHLSGYNHALSSSLRDGPIRGQEKAFRARGWEGKRVVVVHGTRDRTVPPKYAGRIERILSGGGSGEMMGGVEGEAGEAGQGEGGEGEGGEGEKEEQGQGQGERLGHGRHQHQHVLSSSSVEAGTGTGTGKTESVIDELKRVKTRRVMIHGGGHDLTISHPEEVVRLIGEVVEGRGKW